MIKQNVSGLQWIASESWSTSNVLHTPDFMPHLRGTLGIAIRRGEIPGLHDFLLKIRPGNRPDNNLVSILFHLVYVKIEFQNDTCFEIVHASSGEGVLGADISV